MPKIIQVFLAFYLFLLQVRSETGFLEYACPEGSIFQFWWGCLACSPGSYSVDGDCLECDAGTFTNSTGNTDCFQCSGGTYSSEGAISCSLCSAGTYSEPRAPICSPCSAGTYSSDLGTVTCSQCPAGNYSIEGSTECQPCNPGSYSQAGASNCSLCSAGTYSSDPGTANCSQCLAGSFSIEGATGCQLCNPGNYSQAGASSCSPCPAGNYSSDPGAASCLVCPAGTFSPAGAAQCQQCDAGSYSDPDSSSCLTCPAGMYSSDPGAASCLVCPAGTFSPEGATQCQQCDAGTYSTANASGCSPCSAGTFSVQGAAECQSCIAGTYSAEDSATNCIQCDAGTYSDQSATSCTQCSAGTYSSSSGAPSCSLCSVVTYTSELGSTSCSTCPRGTFSSEGAAQCTSIDSLDNSQGFRIGGNIHYSMSGAGDFNNDGIEDIIFGYDTTDDSDYYGAAYIIYGGTSENIDLPNIQPSQGFKITGPQPSAELGGSVSRVGDFNGDGIDDVVISSSGSNALYVLYGNTNPTNIDTQYFNSNQGLQITGNSLSLFGFVVSGAGDINGDGLADIITTGDISDSDFDDSSTTVYVVYGSRNPENFDIGSLTPTQGFQITVPDDIAYVKLSGAGDVNNDGFADILIGKTGIVYVVYGSSSSQNLNAASLAPSQGYQITKSPEDDEFGISVSEAGDFNADGFADFIIGDSSAGAAYIIYGSASPQSIDISNGLYPQGLQITGQQSFSNFGVCVSAAGDYNGDGISDVIIGTNNDVENAEGSAYVIYGTKDSTISSIDTNNLAPSQGFQIIEPTTEFAFGNVVSYTRGNSAHGTSNIMIYSNMLVDNSNTRNAIYVLFSAS